MLDPNPKALQNELEQITREITWYEGGVRKSVKLALQYKLEPEIAAIAATQSTEHIAAMREALTVMEESFDDLEACIDPDLDFHLTLAEAVGNPVILAIIDSIVDVLG